MSEVASCTESCKKEPYSQYNPHFIKQRPVKGYPHVIEHHERQHFPKKGYKKYIALFKVKDSRKEHEKKRRLTRARTKARTMNQTATLEMKLSQKGPLSPDAPKGVADLKYGMSSVNNITGIQQNTGCMFDQKEVKKPKKAEDEVEEDPNAHLEKCRTHHGFKKAKTDQANPYKQQNLKLPLSNLSPYLKETRGLTDEEETKIIDILTSIKKKVHRWDDYEQERLRRFLEVQNPEFRRILLEIMKEHIQEINLVDSFFIRNQPRQRPMTAQPNRGQRGGLTGVRKGSYKEKTAQIVSNIQKDTKHETMPEKVRNNDFNDRMDAARDTTQFAKSGHKNGFKETYKAKEALKMTRQDTDVHHKPEQVKKEVRMMVDEL